MHFEVRSILKVALIFAILALFALVGSMSASEGDEAAPDVSEAGVEESEITLAKVRSINVNTDSEVFADKATAITLTSGYAQKNNEKMTTSGLSKVPMGAYVYLDSRSQANGEKDILGWSWSLKAPSGSTARIEGANSRTPRFKADRAGKYVATLVATDSDGRRLKSSVEVNAGRYVGGEWCTACHNGSVMPDIVSKWQETGHATKFVDTYASYSSTSDYCVRCHTVGYDETDKAGGFDDAVKMSGYDVSKGSFLSQVKGAKKTLDEVIADPRIARFANIQCENCHGPGGSSHTGSKSYETGVCDQCHGQNQQWRNSKHAIEPPLHMAEGASCVECHTSQGYVAVKQRGQPAVFPAVATASKKATIPDPGAMSPIGCVTCHDPHTATYPFKAADGQIKSLQLRVQGEVTMPNGLTVDAEVSAVCVTCHANKRDLAYKADYVAGKMVRGTHDNSQADVFYGAGAFEFGRPFGSSAHKVVVEEGCAQCHMAETPGFDSHNPKFDPTAPGYNKLGKHTWAMEADGVENAVNACGGCHSGLTTYNRPARGDYDGDGRVAGVQDEVKGLLEIVSAALPKGADGAVLSSTISPSNTNELQRKALWNYWLIKNDGSNGIHNTRFAVEVLQETYAELTGGRIPGAAAP
ncbi:MAG: hypothetical protein HY675_13180 [Chloroflexi bacterium]|nr:hypothetical protein [Chloroflexota bacterium]